MRPIEDILHFRNDVSPFLTHLTRDNERLTLILDGSFLKPGTSFMSSAAYGLEWDLAAIPADERPMLQAISFTETPLSEINSLIEIENRKVNLSNYGLVFIKNQLRSKGVSPAIYLNNVFENHSDTIIALQGLMKSNPEVAKKLLPLVTHFGNTDKGDLKRMDFSWEREWRYPAAYGNLDFEPDNVFVGLCPIDRIDEYEDKYGNKFAINDEPLCFIDPLRPARWFASKLVKSRKRIGMEYSVV